MHQAPNSDDTWGTRTRWTIVQSAANVAQPDRTQAWSELIERYREPVRIALLRRLRGHPEADQAAADFFAYLFEQGVLSKVDRESGRFRCYMQGVIRRYAQSWLRSQSGVSAVPNEDLDRVGVSEEDALEGEDERRWASTVLGNAFDLLRRAHPRDAELLVRGYGLENGRVHSRSELSSQFGLTETALDVAMHRARKRLRDRIVEEVCETVALENELHAELKLLLTRLPLAYANLNLGQEH